MMRLLRRWFGLRCWLRACPLLLDERRPYAIRCAECGKVTE